jgi:hypothetical protein
MVIAADGQRSRTKSRGFWLALSIVPLTAACMSSERLPVEPRVLTVTETKIVVPEPPRRPDQIAGADFARFEVITHANISQILEDVESGKRDPLNHVALNYQDYLTLAAWMADIERYIKQSEAYFSEVERQRKEITPGQ